MGLGKFLKKVGGKIGDVAKKAAPLATFIPGVGPVAAGIIGVGGGLLGKLNDGAGSFGAGLKGGLKDAALYGATGYGGAKAIDHFLPGMSGAKIPGVGGGLPPLGSPGQQVNADGIRYDDPSTLGHITSPGGGGGIGDWLKGTSMTGQGGEGGVPNWMKLIGLAGGVAGTVQNAQANTQNRQLTEEQIAQARDAIARQKMLQDRALMPINVQAPDYTSIFSQTQNPFYQRAQ